MSEKKLRGPCGACRHFKPVGGLKGRWHHGMCPFSNYMMTNFMPGCDHWVALDGVMRVANERSED